MEFVAKPHSVIDLRKTVLSHGWVNLAPWNWDDKQGILRRTERFSSGQTADFEVTQKDSKDLLVRLNRSDGNPGYREADRIVRRWLSLNWDPKPALSVARDLSPKVARFSKAAATAITPIR